MIVESNIDKIDDLPVKDPVDKVTDGATPNQPQGEPRGLFIKRDEPLARVNHQARPSRNNDEKRDSNPSAGIRHKAKSCSRDLDISEINIAWNKGNRHVHL